MKASKIDPLKNKKLFDRELESGLPLRLAYMGLQAVSHKVQFLWNPPLLKSTLLPYDDIDFDKILQELIDYQLICREGSWGTLIK